jgi:hypothetical protein
MNIFPKNIPNPTTDKCVIISVFQKKIMLIFEKGIIIKKLYYICGVIF